MQAELIIEAGKAVGSRYPIRSGQQFILGRSHDANVVLDDSMISRNHAMVEVKEDKLWATDLYSTNGTFLDQSRLTPNDPAPVTNNQVLRLGNHEIRIQVEGQEEGKPGWVDRQLRLAQFALPEDKYEVFGQIGKGSFGRVWAAREKLTGRKVAIKMLKASITADSEEYHRFIREAKLCCLVNSDYVVRVYTFSFTSDDRPYLVMELVNGPTVKDLLQGGSPMTLREALLMGDHVAQALGAAHKVGVIHRDVKPQNILITRKGDAKLADFGIARMMGGTIMTETGLGLGTLAYVAPEQALNAREVTEQADIYSLGATIYHAIDGAPPFSFRAPSSAAQVRVILDQIKSERPKQLERCAKDIAEFVALMLSKAPGLRPRPEEVSANLRGLRLKHCTRRKPRDNETAKRRIEDTQRQPRP